MSRLLFENSKFALGFAGVTLFGAAVFAGVSDFSDTFGGEDEAVAEAAEETKEAAEAPAANAAPPPPAQPVGFAEDEMLIDEADGFSTSPSEVAELGNPGDFNPGGDGLDGSSDNDGFDGSSNRASASPAPSRPRAGDGDGDSGGGVRPTNVPSRNLPTPER